ARGNDATIILYPRTSIRRHPFVWRTIEGSLLASGAKGIGGTAFTKRLYICARSLTQEWPEVLRARTVVLARHGESWDVLPEVDGGDYVCGIVRAGRASVLVTSGAGLDLESQNNNYFISLDFARTWRDKLFSKNVEAVAQKIEQTLVDSGASIVEPLL